MKIVRSMTGVERYVITDLEGLDPITVYLTDYAPGQGKVVIECFGEAWSHFWPAMGANRSTRDFILKVTTAYLANKLARTTYQTDFDKINDDAAAVGIELGVTSDVEVAMAAESMEQLYGEYWAMDLPRCDTPEVAHLTKIIEAIKSAFTESSPWMLHC